MLTIRQLEELPPAKREELAGVMACDEEVGRFDEFVAFLETDFASLDPARRVYLVAECEGRIVGFLRLWHSPHVDEWFNDGMVVDPAHRRRGIGRRLLREALRVAGRMGAASLVAQIRRGNPASIRLHESAGFLRETTNYVNSHGQPRSGVGWQYRIRLGP